MNCRAKTVAIWLARFAEDDVAATDTSSVSLWAAMARLSVTAFLVRPPPMIRAVRAAGLPCAAS